MDKDIIAEAKAAYQECVEAEADNRDAARDDLRFGRLGEQWPDEVAKLRKGRPMLTINRMPAFIRQVTNDARQNKPSIKVHPADSNADPETAEVINGLIRNIQYTSNADAAYDTGIDFAASCGMGYWRVVTDYACDDTFDIDIMIKRVSDPFTIWGDPYSKEVDSSDWNVAFVEEAMSPYQFRADYRGAEKVSWETDEESESPMEDKEIRVVEYWTRDKVMKTVYKLSDGQIVLEDVFDKVNPDTGLSMRMIAEATGVQIVAERETMSYKVTQRILSGKEVLETNEWKGRFIPIVPVYGDDIVVDGKRVLKSLIRDAKDAQTMFNVWRSASTELVGLAPKAPFIGPKGAFKSDKNWQTANVKSHPYLEYDGTTPPQRQPFAGVPAGALQEALNASDDMKAILGIYDASLGARSNETSGVAIRQRQQEGDVSTFHFQDNMARAIRHTGRILIDLIPHVYTGERIVRVLGEDGTPSNVQINQQQQTAEGMKGLYQLGAGKYDLTVQVGPSYTTRRQEAADQMTQVIQAFPDSAPIIAPRLAKNLDWPEAKEIGDELARLNPATQPPQDPMQAPEMVKAQAQMQVKQQELQLKQQETAMQLQMKQAELELKKQEAELDAQLKIAEFQADTEMLQQKHQMTMGHAKEQQMAKLHGDTINMVKPVEGEGGEMKHPLMMLVESVAMSTQATQAANMQLAQAVTQNTQAIVESNERLAMALTQPETVTMTAPSGKTYTAVKQKVIN